MVLFEEEDIKLFILIALVVRCRSQRVSLGFCFTSGRYFGRDIIEFPPRRFSDE